MPKKTTKRRSKGRRKKTRQVNLNLVIWGLLLFTGALVAGLVFLAKTGETPAPAVIPPAPDRPAQVRVELPAIQAEVEAFLAATGFSPGQIKRNLEAEPVRYTIQAAFPDEVAWQDLQKRLKDLAADLVLTPGEHDMLTLHRGDRLILTLFFVPPPQMVAEVKGPRVAIIMDDLGRGVYPAQVLLGLKESVTFAILPAETDAVRVATLAHEAGREVVLHMPMEPQGYPAVNPGADALFVRYDDEQIRQQVVSLLDQVPHVVGANNHMGSRFTEYRQGMRVVMEEMRRRGLFFVDSLTTGKSVVAETAAEVGVPTLRRDVFLDNVADTELIVRELRRLSRKARENGQAVGICHPYPETLEALRRELPKLSAEGIRFVTISSLMSRRVGGAVP